MQGVKLVNRDVMLKFIHVKIKPLLQWCALCLRIRHEKRRGRHRQKDHLFRARKRHRRLEALWSSLEGDE